MKTLLVLAILILEGFQSAMAQSCPQSINGVSQLRENIFGWESDATDDMFTLENVLIIDGPRRSGQNEPEPSLAPKEINKIMTWRFSKAIGSNEVWMRCLYSGTSITLTARVHSDVVECFRKDVHSPNQPKKTW
jgi:hypothetical protein